ncbi:porin family protein [Mesorhizobium australicum]|uniref:outer membrane protein n=1 Tax=Mesorhizobium australicum TaxID=536018 RepID=UPI00041EED94|nr:outer membrane protein [Mesorhizobium sp. LNHC220B00]
MHSPALKFDGNYVVGVEADINFADSKSDDNAFPAFPGAFASSDLQWFGSTRLRAGYAFDRFLPFVTGGVAFAKYSGATNFLGGSSEISDTRVGWTLGAGLEYAVTDNLIGRVEYRYSDYSRGSVSPPFSFPTQPVGLDLKTNDVRVGLSYKF